MASMKCLFTK